MGRERDVNENDPYHSQRSHSRSTRDSRNMPKPHGGDDRDRSHRRDRQDDYVSGHDKDRPRRPQQHGRSFRDREYQDDYDGGSRFDERRRRDDNRYYRRDYYDPPTSEHLARFESEEQDAAFTASPWDDEDESYYTPARSSRDFGYREGNRPLRAATRFFERVQTTFTKHSAAVNKPQKSSLWGKLKKNKRLSIVLALLIVFGCIAPSLTIAVTAYQQYSQLKTLGTNGLHELIAVKDLVSLTTKTADPASGIEGKGRAVLQPAVLDQIKTHSDNALTDFQQLNTIIAGRQGVLGLAGMTPFAGKVNSLGHVARLGVDLATILQQFAMSGNDFTALFQGKLLDPTGGPLFTPTTFTQVMQLLAAIQVNVDDAARQIAGVNLADLPISHAQAAQFQQISSILPGVVQGVDTIVNNRDALRWLLGIDSPRLLLVQTMDRGELRATGGFTGQFGTLAINGGRVGKISLSDVNVLDTSSANPFNGKGVFDAPSPYNTWWPFAGFGLRDANLSADFPTSAKLAMYYFTHEGGPQVDGVITFSPLLIEHLLEPNVLGPLTLPCYNETITADNLEDKLHYYQLGPGIAKQAACAKSADTTLRKQFTAALSEQLQTRLRTAQPDQQGKAIGSIMNDVKDKEVEIYFNNPDAEAFLTKTGADYAMLRDPNVDTTMVVQSNIGGNKGSTFVTTKLQETITLAPNGDAQHNLTITLAYQPTGNVYGFQITPTSPQAITYRDYIRVYVPSSAKFVSGGGFDQNHSPPLCNGSCVPKGAPVCTKTATNPTGVFTPGYSPYSSPNEGSGNSTINQIGGPTNTTSDEPGLSMFGGLVVLPGFCTATISLQWTVPHISAGTGQPYTFVEQGQSDAFPDTTIQIQPPQGSDQTPITKHVTPLYASIKVTFPG